MTNDVESYVTKTLNLLEIEREAEISEERSLKENVPPKELQSRGLCLLKLRIGSRHTGLYGRSVFVFEPAVHGRDLPSHNFTPGDIAGVCLSQGDSGQQIICQGIVSRVLQNAVSVAFDEGQDNEQLDDTSQYRIIKLANDVTYKRLKFTMKLLNNYRNGPAQHLIDVLLNGGDVSPPFSIARDGNISKTAGISFTNTNLDASQKEAVLFALQQRELAIIHGPPGTGKTTTVVEIITQAVKQKNKVLACAPSNIAVDNLVERLARNKLKVVRLGHPARVLANIQKYSLDAILASSEETKLVKDVRRDMDKTISKLKKSRNGGERQSLREEMRHLRKELQERESAAMREILRKADVVLSTLTSATGDGPLKFVEEDHFDLVVIDECSQAMEAACWIPLLRGPRCILAGDHNQLPPTIVSNKAAKEGLAVTLMERLLSDKGDATMRMLTVQYRMHELIMRWASQQLYNNKLTAHGSVASHLLRDLDGITESEDTSIPLLLIDTAGCNLNELNLPDEVSKGNEGEADLVAHHVEKLIESGLPQNEIAVIAPYNLQVELLRARLVHRYSKIEIKSVDGFQGREKEAVIISMVRSNKKGQVGFLAEDRRINVAITRARRHLAVVCDSETVGRHKFLKSLVDYMTEFGEVRSAHQYESEGLVIQPSYRPEHLDGQLDRKTQRDKDSTKTHTKQHKDGARPKTQKQARLESEKTPVNAEKKTESRKHFKEDTHTLEDDTSRRDELETQIREFKKNRSIDEHSFSPSLNSYERMLVHEISEDLGLVHISEGAGAERHITIRKQRQSDTKSKEAVDTSGKSSQNQNLHVQEHKETKHKLPGKNNSKKSQKSSQNSSPGESAPSKASDYAKTETKHDALPVQADEPKTTINCDKCNKDIPIANFDLHKLRCDKIPSATPPTNTTENKQKPNKKKKKPKSAKQDRKNEEEDFDALIASAVKENTVCNFPKCKNYTTCLGQNCSFCAKRFCLSHHIPEIHGCGAAAKASARSIINKDGVLYRGSGVASKKPDPTKRAHLERKLEKKLTDLSQGREKKKKEKS